MTGPEPYAVSVPKGYRVGPWEVRDPIATGAFGSVYEARWAGGETGEAEVLSARNGSEARAERPKTAALKFLPTGTGTPRQLTHLRELAEREVELHRRLKDPRLIRLYDTLTVDDADRPQLDGATVLVLEKAETSLAALLARTPRPPDGPALLAQVCAGLAQLHRANWVHGDLKPANVLLMKDGSARLADFNMAAELEGTHAYTPAFSTPDYTPPELLWSEIGERGRQIRPSADVWAFGVLAHLVLTGSFPLPGGTPSARRDAAVAYARASDELRLSPELPDAWREIVHGCLSRTGRDRPSTRALLPQVETAAGAPRSRGPLLRRLSRRAAVATAAGIVAVTSAAAYGVTNWARQDGGSRGTAGATATGTAQVTVNPATYGASELRTDKGIPVKYRVVIVDTAHKCANPYVTPALIAGMLKVESNFDPDLSDPAKGEYGIARWTPNIMRWWMNDNGEPARSTPTPPLSPTVSIQAMGRYLCFIPTALSKDLPGDERVLIAAGYRTSYKVVNKAGGVPPQVRSYATRLTHYLKEYTPPGRK
ncbi:serine/threonine protein kinase [Actinobacteria bacterium OK074]|nr:serine/threonine protein kinase [Actinobacteria bacterium OK074]